MLLPFRHVALWPYSTVPLRWEPPLPGPYRTAPCPLPLPSPLGPSTCPLPLGPLVPPQDTIQLVPLSLSMVGMMLANPVTISRVLLQVGGRGGRGVLREGAAQEVP